MKVAIIQLSDIHLRSKNDFILKHKENFYRSCKGIINECSKLVIVITGDISSSGKKEEYELAYNWLKESESAWKKEAQSLNSVDYVIVPGNHDCDFSVPSEVRKTVIERILKNDILDNKELSDACLNVQNNFWSFYNKLVGKDCERHTSWRIDIPLKLDYKLIFCCYNSAFLSQLNEKPGDLLIPENIFLKPQDNIGDKHVVLSIFHHNTGWLNPNTDHNNKKAFEEHLYSYSNIVMCGHEHYSKQRVISGLDEFQELIYLESPAFQMNNDSEYVLLFLDTDEDVLHRFYYKFNNDYYHESSSSSIHLSGKSTGISLTSSWIGSLDKISIPLKHIRKENLRLSDIFVYPDLQLLSDIDNKYIQYFDSEKLISERPTERVVFLEGENQSGKTSLLRMLYSSCYKKGVYPIMLTGKYIKHPNISSLIEREYKIQYCNELYSYSEYKQLDRSCKIIFIDDFDDVSLNSTSKSMLLDNLLCNFEKIIITNGQQMDIRNLLLHTKNDNEIKRYRILSLGYHKRNILIEKWIRLGQDHMTLDEDFMLDQVKQTYDKITVLLGQQLIPSYPMFVLSLLQGLNQAMDNFNVSKTSYAYCYNSLIISSLLRSGTDKDKINGVLKYLSEFSYYYYNEKNGSKNFSMSDFEIFYDKYKKEYNVPFSAEKLMEKICDADLIRFSHDDGYSFSYRYVFYYLVAQKISQLVNDNKADGITKKLCNKLHKEKEANILIFLVYHNGTEKQMEDILFASWLPFEDFKPITLKKDDVLFNDLNNIIDGIKAKVLLKNVDPHKNRDSVLRESDAESRKLENCAPPSEEEFEQNKCLRDINNTFKIIRILGQIVKNQKETLKKEQIVRLIEESYNVCFRSLAFFNRMIDDFKEDIITFFLDKNQNSTKLDENTIRIKVQHMLYMLLYQQCLVSFANLSCSVGTSDMSDIYDEVAARFNTPAAKIITFTIKTYYNKMKIRDLQTLVDEFNDNPVAMEIIKARVLNYVYNNYVDFRKRQRIGELCNLKLVDNSQIAIYQKNSTKS